MKRVLLLAVVIVSAAGTAFAQGGTIGVYADPQGMNPCLNDKTAGLTSYYIVHVYTAGATACQFSAPKPACMQALWLSDTGAFPVTVGNTQTGMSVAYGACRLGPIHVTTVNFFSQGSTPPCCHYPVLPDPYVPSGRIEVSNCAFQVVYATGGHSVVNEDRALCSVCSIPVEETTWGRVKTLFAE